MCLATIKNKDEKTKIIINDPIKVVEFFLLIIVIMLY